MLSVTYPEVFMGRPVCTSNPRKYLPPDAIKMYSLALPVLRFLCKTFCKLPKFTLRNILLRAWFSKNSYIQINICVAINMWELGSDLSWKDAASSTEGITRTSVNYSHQRNQKFKIKKSNICLIFYALNFFFREFFLSRVVSLFFSSVWIFVF